MTDNDELLDFVYKNNDPKIQEAIFKAHAHLEPAVLVACSISGGSDSDIMMDILYRLDKNKKVKYIYSDTGLEYEATKKHLSYLEDKYGIKIERVKAKMPIPIVCRDYGQPFLSKQISEFIGRLQQHGFSWEDEPLDVLLAKYPKCKAALRWWCNDFGENSRFNIGYRPFLKEFMIENPPDFKISSMCCSYAKKSPLKQFIEQGGFDLSCVGVRKSEGGVRSTVYKNCFTPSENGEIAQFRPIYWIDNPAKEKYKEINSIKFSDCYEVWGLKRTGCAACPYGLNWERELAIIEKYEPKLFLAVNKIFGKSYEYTKKYNEFRRNRNENQKY